uniref:chemotaxis protein CheW n=1 Tax=Stappia sp. TaxID=1870903 RepID=UPI003BA9EE3F
MMHNDNLAATAEDSIQYVTVVIGGQLFGLPISQVHDVFVPESVTRVPLAAPEVAGVLNLRGRIVTAIDMRKRLHLPDRDENSQVMAVGIEHKGESYGLVIDTVGEVLRLANSSKEPNPSNLDKRWAEISGGVHRLDGKLMIILDVSRLFGAMVEPLAAA